VFVARQRITGGPGIDPDTDVRVDLRPHPRQRPTRWCSPASCSPSRPGR
jgi:hypothetical protein